MRQSNFRQGFQSTLAFIVILFLLPYIITVIMHGARLDVSGSDVMSAVEVKVVQEDGREEVVTVSWEEFFLGALAREIPENSELEFIKAQAVLLRTNAYKALSNAENPILEERFLTKEELEKKCMNMSDPTYYEKLRQAMVETGQEVLFYGENYATVPFHQSSNGATRNYQEVTGREDCPYVGLRECPQDKEADDEMQVLTFECKEVQKKCQSFLVAVSEEEAEKVYQFSDFEIISYDSAGYVAEIRIGDTHVTGDQFRDALSLPSSAFSLEDAKGQLRVVTMGKGHGLGMSQWTANEMAKEGKTYQEILRYFYEGTNLTKKTVGVENQ